MNNDPTQKLIKAFPLLYADCISSPSSQRSFMHFGFSCGDGWFDLLWDLSAKLEPLIQNHIDSHPNVCECQCQRIQHELDGPCTTKLQIPYSIRSERVRSHIVPERKTSRSTFMFLKAQLKYRWWCFKNTVQQRINQSLEILKSIGLYKTITCPCNQFIQHHPRAVQVKEKFGGLRFYMNFGNKKIYETIRQAEYLSHTICEECGAPGEMDTSQFWLRTLCPACIELRKNAKRY